MDHYRFYSVEDFVQDFRFRSWVRHPLPQEDAIWKKWISENVHQQAVVEEARAVILAIHPVDRENISDNEIENEIKDILANLEEDAPEGRGSQKSVLRRISYASWIKAAASVTILMLGGWLAVEINFKEDREQAIDSSVVSADHYMIERVNKSADTLLINLPDNSSVLLSQNSLIRYPRKFTPAGRKVFLEGTAFFEVTKDPNNPFYVEAGKILAKVLGTSFEISTDQPGTQVRVTVKTGTVSIYSAANGGQANSEREPKVVLTQHEQFIYQDEASQVQHTRLDSFSREALTVPDTYLKFSATPASEVFTSLAKVYGVRISFDDAQIEACSITASFTDEPFPLKLDLICRSIGLKYEIVNDQVTITGEGCKKLKH